MEPVDAALHPPARLSRHRARAVDAARNAAHATSREFVTQLVTDDLACSALDAKTTSLDGGDQRRDRHRRCISHQDEDEQLA